MFEGRELLREPEACERLGLQQGELNRLLRHGTPVPCYQVGDRAKFFDWQELSAWWESKKRNGQKEKAQG